MRAFWQAWRDPRGSMAVEFALTVPLFLALVLGVVEVGRIYWSKTTLEYAVAAAARCAAVDAVACATPTSVQNYAVAQATGLHLASSVFALSNPACGAEVDASYDFHFITSLVFKAPITLHAKACFPT